jgi:hypothetical protein
MITNNKKRSAELEWKNWLMKRKLFLIIYKIFKKLNGEMKAIHHNVRFL